MSRLNRIKAKVSKLGLKMDLRIKYKYNKYL